MLPWFLRQNTKVAPDRCCNFRVRCSHSRTLCHSSSAVLAVSNYVVSMKKKIDDNFNEPPQVSHLEWFDWPSCKKLRLHISTICNADWKQVLPFARRQFSRSTTVGLSPGYHLYRCYDTNNKRDNKALPRSELPMLASAFPSNPTILLHDDPLGTAIAGGTSIDHSPFTFLQQTLVASWQMGRATYGCSTGTFVKCLIIPAKYIALIKVKKETIRSRTTSIGKCQVATWTLIPNHVFIRIAAAAAAAAAEVDARFIARSTNTSQLHIIRMEWDMVAETTGVNDVLYEWHGMPFHSIMITLNLYRTHH